MGTYNQEIARLSQLVDEVGDLKSQIQSVAQSKDISIQIGVDTPLSVLTKIKNGTIKTPTDTIPITNNGIVDVTNYASAEVNVSGLSINGDIIQAKIASGQTIKQGDFVSYVENSLTQISDLGTAYTPIILKKNDTTYYVCHSIGTQSLMITEVTFKYNETSGEYDLTATDHEITLPESSIYNGKFNACLVHNGNDIVVVSNMNNSSWCIRVIYLINTTSFEIVKTMPYDTGNNGNTFLEGTFQLLPIDENTVNMIWSKRGNYNSTYYTENRFNQLTVLEDNTMTLLYNSNLERRLDGQLQATTQPLFIDLGNGYSLTCGNASGVNGSSATSTRASKNILISVIKDTTITTTQIITPISSFADYMSFIKISDNKVLLLYGTYLNQSYGNYMLNYALFGMVLSISGTSVSLLGQFPISLENYSGTMMSGAVLNENKVIVFHPNDHISYKLRASTIDITDPENPIINTQILDDTTYSIYGGVNAIKYNDNNIILLFKGATTSKNLELKTLNGVSGEIIDTTRADSGIYPYLKDHGIMGVSNEDGISGDTIKIYVPNGG